MLLSAAACWPSEAYIEKPPACCVIEYPRFFIALSVVRHMMMVSAGDLIRLYMEPSELKSLALLRRCGPLRRDSVKSTESKG